MTTNELKLKPKQNSNYHIERLQSVVAADHLCRHSIKVVTNVMLVTLVHIFSISQ